MSHSNCLTNTHGKGNICPHCDMEEPPEIIPYNETRIKRVKHLELPTIDEFQWQIEGIQRQLESLMLCGSRAQRKLELAMAREIPNNLWLSHGV